MRPNKDYGLVCFLDVGMTEVSTRNTTVKEGDYFGKGDQLGMFHYGGSTHCVFFRTLSSKLALQDKKPVSLS